MYDHAVYIYISCIQISTKTKSENSKPVHIELGG